MEEADKAATANSSLDLSQYYKEFKNLFPNAQERALTINSGIPLKKKILLMSDGICLGNNNFEYAYCQGMLQSLLLN